ncbi:hypothetical protein S40285_05053 [Stachybotrys chlorohalonatus IBT 40285]|uniref:Uncharacterized protein n=1 Tax=Stachybotrys chlorohalonatus (strain IBT 40285) TaxID=1283841 RepID=A0A084Q9Q1_STAC4|nr:hypothetical protein S40285_05053 [Stachybotrys chlorohalonata IBT 40285]
MSAAYDGYDPDTQVPDLSGRVILLTGGTSGVGLEAVLQLAKHNPGHLFFTGRNQASASAVIAKCPPGARVTFLACDFTSLASVRDAAARFEAQAGGRLDVFVANAGIMAVPAGLTQDGVEVQFGVNHLGNAALLLRLLPLMLRTKERHPDADVRYVALTSLGYRGHPANGIDFATLHTEQTHLPLGSWSRYGQAKYANVVFAQELHRRHPQILSVAVHPGVVRTELVTRLPFWKRMLVNVTNPRGLMEPAQGACNTLWAATAPDVAGKLEGGTQVALFEPVGRVHAGDKACFDEKIAKELWEWTEEKVGLKV